MKKFLILLISVIACFAMVACAPAFKSTVTEYSGEVSSNGGFVVEKGDYIYFINGQEQKTAQNNFGSVEKGGLYRLKKTDIGSGEEAELVIPKLMFSNKNGNENGVYIFGDYVYYATPCDRKDSEGSVMSDTTEFARTKLDGTETKVIASIKNSDDYRFVKIGDSVFLTLNTQKDEDNVLRVYNADTQALVYETGAISNFKFSSSTDSQVAFYTKKIHNAETDSDESFNAVNMLKLDGSNDTEILNGAGTFSDKENGIGIAGVTYDFVKVTDKLLVLTQTTVATSSVKMYYGMNISDIVLEDSQNAPKTKLNNDKLVLLDKGSSLATYIFADTSIYVDLDAILYFDANYGLVKYDYTKSDVDFGRVRVYYNSKMLNANAKFVKDGYVYMVDSSVVYYRFNLNDVFDMQTKMPKSADTEFVQLNYISLSESWFMPEIVGSYMLVNVNGSPYNGYVYAIDMLATKDMTDEQIEDYAEDVKTENRDNLLKMEKMLIGKKAQSDKDAFTDYLDAHYPQDEDSSSN